MMSKVELELKRKPEPKRSFADAKSSKKGKIELQLKKPPSLEKSPNLIYTEAWQRYSDRNVQPVGRGSEEVKEMLAYRGKRSDGSIGSNESSNSSHYDEHERAESTLSDLLSGSEIPIYEVDGESVDGEADSPPGDPTHGSANSPQTGHSRSSPRQYRYCWYCYETYKAMCLAQGKNPPSVFSRGLWRGHCMRDANGITSCPHLWFTTCTHCGATASSAHSPDFCPMLELTNLRLNDGCTEL